MTIENKNKRFCIYFHRNTINNKIYIGITSLKLKDRFGKNGINYKHNKHFYSAIQKYGWDNFEHIVFMEDVPYTDACKYEQILIKLWNTNNPKFGYNKSIGGEASSLGVKHTKESKLHMSEAKLKDKNPMFNKKHNEDYKTYMHEKMSGENNPWYGKKLPEDMRQKISVANKGKTAWNKGLKMDDEFVDKICIPVFCIEMNMYFKSLTEAGNVIGVGNQHISSCCKGKLKHAGRHPQTGEKLSWRYATKEEYREWVRNNTKLMEVN